MLCYVMGWMEWNFCVVDRRRRRRRQLWTRRQKDKTDRQTDRARRASSQAKKVACTYVKRASASAWGWDTYSILISCVYVTAINSFVVPN